VYRSGTNELRRIIISTLKLTTELEQACWMKRNSYSKAPVSAIDVADAETGRHVGLGRQKIPKEEESLELQQIRDVLQSEQDKP
jgi:hypothetical protein